jgi:magnesium chelatase family protein
MKLSLVYTRALQGLHSTLVIVEVHLLNGLPNFSIVGLPEAVVKESKDRVRSAIVNSGFEFPRRRIVINLAPADLPKSGGGYDLPIALGLLVASQQLDAACIEGCEFIGELALSGELRDCKGVVPIIMGASRDKRRIFLPNKSAQIASITGYEKIYGANSLSDIFAFLSGKESACTNILPSLPVANTLEQSIGDLSEIKGQELAKKSLEIAAAGGHNMLMIGPPGTGKTMLANRILSIMPALNDSEALEVASILSISNNNFFDTLPWKQRPFRNPHHTASSIAIAGGGSIPKPGEVSLAHHGVLFLDEFPEFSKKALEVLREPMSSGHITISRARSQEQFPAQFQLIAAMNPCPCGQLTNPFINCSCSLEQIRRYLSKISGPILDRIDIHIDVPYISAQFIAKCREEKQVVETSAEVKLRVDYARNIQIQRAGKINANLSNSEVEQYCCLSPEAQELLTKTVTKFHLSARSYYKIIKLAQTITDLKKSETATISSQAVAEALSLRVLDRREEILQQYNKQ